MVIVQPCVSGYLVGKTVPRAMAAINAFWHPDVYPLVPHAVRVLSLASMHQQVWTGREASGGVISLLTLKKSFIIRKIQLGSTCVVAKETKACSSRQYRLA